MFGARDAVWITTNIRMNWDWRIDILLILFLEILSFWNAHKSTNTNVMWEASSRNPVPLVGRISMLRIVENTRKNWKDADKNKHGFNRNYSLVQEEILKRTCVCSRKTLRFISFNNQNSARSSHILVNRSVRMLKSQHLISSRKAAIYVLKNRPFQFIGS